MTPDQIREELKQLADKKEKLEQMLVQLTLPSEGSNACKAAWRPDGSCGYCGSMAPAEAIRRLSTPETEYSGADWKYGYPHKFYIGSKYPHKFYSIHLKDATEEEFAEFNILSKAYLGISWAISSDQVLSLCSPNTQQSGKTLSRKEIVL